MNKFCQKSLQDGLLDLSHYTLLIKRCITLTLNFSKLATTSHLALLICILSVISVIFDTLGTHSSMSVTGEWGILKTIPVNSDSNQSIYDQIALGRD